MPKVDAQTLLERKERVFLTLRRQSGGMYESELADSLKMERRTLNNYLRALETEGKIYKEEGTPLWIALPYDQAQLRKFELSPEEAMTLYLATRLFVKQNDKQNEPAQTALMKLAAALVTDAKIGNEIHQAAQELSRRPDDGAYNRIFRTLMQAYIYRRVAHLTYEPANGKAFDTDFAPYLLEPSAIGYTTYAIGQSSIVNALRTYKLERIKAAALTRQEYSVPPDFPGLAILQSAWSIIHGEERVTVTLRFSPAVRKRVLETCWHHSEQKSDDAEKPGYLLWKAQVADTTDMLPWIRGWGADCEVVEPKELREELRGEVKQMTRVYGIAQTKQMPPRWLLWAKTNRPKNTQLHLLICHLIDVGNVARAMWERVFTGEFKRQIADAFGLTPDETGRLLAFLAAMHDLGKACPIFQAHLKGKPKFTLHYEEIVKAGYKFPDNKESCAHGFVSTAALVDLLQFALNMPLDLARQIAVSVGGHHGRWPTSNEWGDLLVRAGGDEWKKAREELLADVKRVFNPPTTAKYAIDPETANMLLVALSGITSVTDWLGSMENHFGYVESIDHLEKYASDSRGIAEQVLEKEGWTQWQPPTQALTFSEQFESKTPRGAQLFVIELAEKLSASSLVIIEDATGSGKTEAAWYLADHWTRVLGNRGVYVAMPTMATSNSLHDRVTKFLEARYSSDHIKPILVHSQARFADDEPERKMQSNDDADQTSKGSEVNALAWFEDKRKRSLLAPFGVGTVDQTFLSVLQTNHFFVRLFALGRKTVIFDEVHAYDTYMTEIFQTLLRWLRVMGSSAIILSATLPVATRRKLVEAYGGDVSKVSDAEASSIVTSVSDTTTEQKPLPLVERSPLRVEWIEHSPEAIAKKLREEMREEMREGGCVAVICNRVARAQEVYRAIKDAFKDDGRFIPRDNLRLFHARFPMVWRDEIEKSVRKQADKNSTRARPFLVVATQVIEQSLDLDFDLMITDLPPMDLLVQRVGRLHRHKEHDGLRPATMKTPRVLITKPEKEGEVPRFGKDEYVYSYYVLLRTWLELKSRERDDTLVLELPKQTRELIEAVYVEGKPNLDSTPFTDNQKNAVVESWKKMRRSDEEEKRKANLRTIDDPDSESLITMDNLELSDDESPQAQEGLSAMTRLCLPNVQLVCLIETAAGLVVLEQREVVDLKQKPNPKLAKGLVRCTVTITRPNVYRHFVAQKASDGWLEHALLKNYRVAKFTPDSNGEYVCSLTQNLSLRLSKERGIEIMQNEERK